MIFRLSLLSAVAITVSAAAPDYDTVVKPILTRYCLQCHGESAKMGDLDLRTSASMRKGGTKGSAVVAGSAEKSLLFRRIAEKSMPMGPKKLTGEEERIIKEWIDAGAPVSEAAISSASKPAGGGHWSFRAPISPEVPKPVAQSWVLTPVDAFVMRDIERKKMHPARPAERVTLLRRAHFILTGLPPTPQEVQAFLADRSADAFDKVIDNLLARPQYGERWSRHWLDVVRYAESNGYERDGTKPSAWRYRDYVIDALNSNKPFDRFLTEQLAGDEIEGSNAESQIATTFLRLGLWDDEPANDLMDRYDQLDDVVAVTSTAFLGITLRCARCHDHKFEPFSQKDYYKMLSFFEPLKRPQKGRNDMDRPVGTASELARYEQAMKAADTEIDPLQRLIANLKRGLMERMLEAKHKSGAADQWKEPLDTVLALRAPADKRSGAQKKLADEFEKKLDGEMLALAKPEEAAQLAGWHKRIEEINSSRPEAPPRAYTWYESGNKAPATHLFHRGDPSQPGDEVRPGIPTVLGEESFESPMPLSTSTGRRLALARWMTRADNPLVARVFVNRVWQWIFGEGLVSSANDFGVMGQKPANQELLDYLASEFVRSRWNVKELQRMILKSNAFRLSSEWDEKATSLDVEQTLLWRWKPRRLEAEAVRDSVLSVSGQLNGVMHGPSIYPSVPESVLAGQSRPGDGWGTSSEKDASRRSVYIFAKRGLAVPEMDLLDTPDNAVSCERRRVSTTGPQALTMMNGGFTQEQARHLAARLMRDSGTDAKAQVSRAFQLALSREPSAKERDEVLSFLAQQKQQIESDAKASSKPTGDASLRALADFCLVLLNTNEFFYIN
jgi:hypothetical protein